MSCSSQQTSNYGDKEGGDSLAAHHFHSSLVHSSLKFCESERGSHATGNSCGLALRGMASFGDGYRVRPHGNPVGGEKACGAGRACHCSCYCAAFDGYRSPAEDSSAGGNNFHGYLSSSSNGNIQRAGCAACYVGRKSPSKIAGFTGCDVLASSGNVGQCVNAAGIGGGCSAAPANRSSGNNCATGDVGHLSRHGALGRGCHEREVCSGGGPATHCNVLRCALKTAGRSDQLHGPYGNTCERITAGRIGCCGPSAEPNGGPRDRSARRTFYHPGDCAAAGAKSNWRRSRGGRGNYSNGDRP